MLNYEGPIVYYVPRGAVVLEGGNNFKISLFLGRKCFTCEKHEGGQILIMTQQRQSIKQAL